MLCPYSAESYKKIEISPFQLTTQWWDTAPCPDKPPRSKKIGASEGIRTLDIHVGNVTLYQTELRSLPNRQPNYGMGAQNQVLFAGSRVDFVVQVTTIPHAQDDHPSPPKTLFAALFVTALPDITAS